MPWDLIGLWRLVPGTWSLGLRFNFIRCVNLTHLSKFHIYQMCLNDLLHLSYLYGLKTGVVGSASMDVCVPSRRYGVYIIFYFIIFFIHTSVGPWWTVSRPAPAFQISLTSRGISLLPGGRSLYLGMVDSWKVWFPTANMYAKSAINFGIVVRDPSSIQMRTLCPHILT